MLNLRCLPIFLFFIVNPKLSGGPYRKLLLRVTFELRPSCSGLFQLGLESLQWQRLLSLSLPLALPFWWFSLLPAPLCQVRMSPFNLLSLFLFPLPCEEVASAIPKMTLSFWKTLYIAPRFLFSVFQVSSCSVTLLQDVWHQLANRNDVFLTSSAWNWNICFS